MDGRLPTGAALRTYIVHERWGFAWIWMGQTARADLGLIPELQFLAGRPGTKTVSGVLLVQANYRHIIDNAMDSAHIATVHRESLHSNGLAQASAQVTKLQDGSIQVSRMGINTTAPPAFVPMWQKAQAYPAPRVDHWADARWYPPAVVTNDVGITPTGSPRQSGMTLRLALAFTPETASSTHYFWTICRNFLPDDAELDREARVGMEHVLKNEDGVILEALQRAIGNQDLLALRPALMSFDQAVVAVRRELDRMISRG
jgi:vanillate O-demethylase monooxygenase subunit